MSYCLCCGNATTAKCPVCSQEVKESEEFRYITVDEHYNIICKACKKIIKDDEQILVSNPPYLGTYCPICALMIEIEKQNERTEELIVEMTRLVGWRPR